MVGQRLRTTKWLAAWLTTVIGLGATVFAQGPVEDQSRRTQFDAGSIHDAAKTGDLAKVTALLKRNPALVFSKDALGSTPLHLAAANSHRDVAELLLARKADVNARANDGTTPLHQAAFDGSREIAAMLLAKNADVNAKDVHNCTPLHAAAAMGYKDVAELLLANKADIDAECYGGKTPFQLAVGRGHSDVAEFLHQQAGTEPAGRSAVGLATTTVDLSGSWSFIITSVHPDKHQVTFEGIKMKQEGSKITGQGFAGSVSGSKIIFQTPPTPFLRDAVLHGEIASPDRVIGIIVAPPGFDAEWTWELVRNAR